MARGNAQRTGQSPFHGPGRMRVRWQVDLQREICASPAVAADGTIYVGAGTLFYGIAPDGRVLWTHNFADGRYSMAPKFGNQSGDNQAFTSPCPALAADGTIYQACARGKGSAGDGFVIAMEPAASAERRIRWVYKTGREMRSSPLVAGGTCFVGDAMLLALDASGRRLWEGGKCDFAAVTSSPALSASAQTLYIGGFDGRLHALDARSGAELWAAGPSKPSPLRRPQWDEQGVQTRRFTTGGYVPEAPAVGADGTIWFGSWDGRLYAAAPDGRLLGAVDLEDRVSSPPAVSRDGRVLVCTYEGTLCAVRAVRDGPAVQWRAEANARYSAPLVTVDGKAYVGTLDGKLRAYGLTDGRLLDEIALGGWIHASPVPGGDGLLYVGASDGFLRAIDSAGPLPEGGGEDGRAKPQAAEETVAGKGTKNSGTDRAERRPAATPGYDEALRLARAYLAETDEGRRGEILQKVRHWSERLDDIALALRPKATAASRRGYLEEDKFTIPGVRARLEGILPRPEGPVLPYTPSRGGSLKGPAPGEEYLNWVYVPEAYDAKRPLGLVISLHGGAGSSPQSSAGGMLRGTAKLLGGGDYVIVAPSTPPMVYRWGSCKFCFPESEIHIQSVIEEYSTRYAIDPNRVFLTGHSMGGIGCWWQAFRHGDRFAAVAPMSGTWRGAYWPKLRGTLLYIVHGVFDHHGTHVDFDRWAHQRLDALGIAHIEAEYLGAHGPGLAEEQKKAMVELFKATRRDPYCRHVCAVASFIPDSPEMAGRYARQPHSFWASVLETGPGGIVADMPGWNRARVYESGDSGGRKWERNMFAVERRLMKAGAVDAENLGGNRFRVKAANVRRFALWLHPKMGVDFSRPIDIELIHVNVDAERKTETEGPRERISVAARPSLAAMLEYLGERRDYGLIYHAVVEVAGNP